MNTARDPAVASRLNLNTRVQNALACLGLSALTLVAYSNSFQIGLAYDNAVLLRKLPQFQEATARDFALILHHSFWWPWTETGLYRPFTSLTYLFNYAIL